MSTVLLLLVAIVLIIIFSILYLIIQKEFDENDFENKLRVVTEYARRTNAMHPLPATLQYVSQVDDHLYVVSTINSANLDVLAETTHDDRIETFNFLHQNFDATIVDDKRVRAHVDDVAKYEIRGDDGWMDVDCPHEEHFNEATMRCEPVPPCRNKTPGLYGLTESMIDTLVLHHRVPRPNVNVDTDVHPTMYLRCLEGGSHVVDECPSNHLFDDVIRQCVLRNDCAGRPDDFVLSVFPESLTINEYMVCRDGDAAVASCPFGKIFDRRLMICVDAEPCATHGEGYTYITDDISDSQFYRCLSSDSYELVTCINRTFVNDQYECSGDVRCTVFENGTGTQLQTHDDDVWTYDSGVLVCDNYNLIDTHNCDSENLLEHKLFNNIFYVSVYIPREMYDVNAGRCIPFDVAQAKVKNDMFEIDNAENDVGVQFTTALVGKTAQAMELLETNRLDFKVVYARDHDAMGINFIDGTELDCYGDHLYDPFEGSRLNRCIDNELSQQITIDEHNYFVPRTAVVRADPDYEQSCAQQLSILTNYIDFDHFTTRILADIVQTDPCATNLTQIHDKYTYDSNKYTTISSPYISMGVKDTKYIERYGSNIPKNDITILATRRESNTLPPLFDPFERYEILQPTFNPWSDEDDAKNVNNLEDLPTTPLPEPPPPVPSLTLTDKQIDFTCFYSVPIYKLSACNVENDHIKEAIKGLRANVTIESGCENAAGLANIINAYAYLGANVGCRSVLSPHDNSISVVIDPNGKTFVNLDTQSNDGIQYNKWIHTRDDMFMACPDHALGPNFTCELEDDKLYYIEDLQT
jgi:Viral capsid protein 91 N-terminal